MWAEVFREMLVFAKVKAGLNVNSNRLDRMLDFFMITFLLS